MHESAIKFIGTGSGKVSLKRFHSAFIIHHENFKLLVDCGDGISKALLNLKEDITKINSILISHFHPDHLNGISLLLIQMKMQKRNLPLKIFVHHNLKLQLVNFLETNMIFFKRYPFEIEIVDFEVSLKIDFEENFSFTAKENSHVDEYKIDAPENQNLFSCSFLFKVKDKNIFYTADAASKNDLYLFENSKIDLMISEVTHVDLFEIVEASKKNEAEKLIFTHISDEIENELFALQSSLSTNSRQIITAVDGMVVQI